MIFSRRELALFWTASSVVFLGSVLLVCWLKVDRETEAFDQRASLVHESIRRRLGGLEAVLVSLVGFQQANDVWRELQFSAFAGELLRAFPHLGSILFFKQVSEDQIDGFVERMHEKGLIQFAITEFDSNTGKLIEVPKRPVYMSLSSIEPMEPLTARFLGYDALSDSALAGAIDKAITSGNIIASLPAGQLQKGKGLFVLKAVYQGHYTPLKSEARRSLVYGIMALILPQDRFLDGVVGAYHDVEIILVPEGPADSIERDNFYHHNSTSGPRENYPWLPQLTFQRSVDIFGQRFDTVITHQIRVLPMLGSEMALALGIAMVLVVSVGGICHHRRVGKIEADKAHRAILAEQQRFKDFAETAADWFWELDSSLRFTYLSERLSDITMISPKEILGLTWQEVEANQSSDREAMSRLFQSLESQNSFHDIETTWVRSDGIKRLIRYGGKPRIDQSGIFLGYRGTAMDITEHKRAEENLREAEAKYRTVVEQASDAIVVLRHGKAVYQNKALIDLLGDSTTKIAGQLFITYIAPKDRQGMEDYCNERLRGNPVPKQYEIDLITQAGKHVVMELKSGVIPYDGQEAILAVMPNVTERKQAETALYRAKEGS